MAKSNSSDRVKWIIIGSLVGTMIGAILSPVLTKLAKNLYGKMGIQVGAPKRRLR